MKIIMRTLFIIALLTFGLGLPARNAEAGYPYAHMTQNYCEVTNAIWDINSADRDKLRLPRAMYHANLLSGSADGGCLDLISITTKQEIVMKGPLTIRATGEEGSPFVLQGGCEPNHSPGTECSGTSTLNASQIPTNKDYKCAVRIIGNYVRLSNLIIKNIPEGMDAVCMEGNYAEMDNVNVSSNIPSSTAVASSDEEGASVKSSAFVISESAKGNRILANSSVKAIDGYAIWIKNPALESLNFLQPYNGAIGATQQNGLSELNDQASRFDIEAVGSGTGDWFKSESPIKVVITRKIFQNTTPAVIKLSGHFVNGDSGDMCNPTNAYKGVKRVQVYAAGGLNNEGRISEGGFIGYVGKKIGANGLDQVTGKFQIELPVQTDNALITLVPETSGGTIGTASQAITATADNDDLPCLDARGNNIGGSGSDGSNGGGSGSNGGDLPDTPGKPFEGYTSIQECKRERSLDTCQGEASCRAPDNFYYDSDGDGLFDNQEDTDGDCECDNGEEFRHDFSGNLLDEEGNIVDSTNDSVKHRETCWYTFDTDTDGVPDGAGTNETINEDTDGDKIPNALDDDSDNDGLKDGVEDRNSIYTRSRGGDPISGIYYRYQNVFSFVPLQVRNADGTTSVKECTLGAEGREVGISYTWAKLACAASDVDCATVTNIAEVAFGNGFAEDATTRFEVVACRSSSLASSANFNGSRQDGNNELDPTHPDTDSDGFCDGGGSGYGVAGSETRCTPGQKPVDSCPLFADATNACTTAAKCNSEQVLFSVLSKWTLNDNRGSPLRFIDQYDWKGQFVSSGDGIPDVVQIENTPSAEELTNRTEMAKATRQSIERNAPGDTDDDGIPDVVENPFSVCPDAANASPREDNPRSWGLKYYLADSDGDGFGDGYKAGATADVCFESFGENDGVGSPTDQLSCDPTKVTETEINTVVALFIDRDNDRLRDAEEDVNLDGDYASASSTTYIGGLNEEQIKLAESNPLLADTDGDSIPDYIERTNPVMEGPNGKLYTHPAVSDTDQDGLSDGFEMLLDGIPGYSKVNSSNGFTCFNNLDHDTNPLDPDTDEDGLKDGVELEADSIPERDFRSRITTRDPVTGIFIINEAFWANGAVRVGSNPNASDSDGDGLSDGEEHTENGEVDINALTSYACSINSDGDGKNDDKEFPGCALNPSPDCEGIDSSIGTGRDSDGDGLSDELERKLGTLPNEADTDKDGLLDGEEDCDLDGIFDQSQVPDANGCIESDAKVADTDGDGVGDREEREYEGIGSNPQNKDTDGDGLADGIENRNRNSIKELSETSAINADTDGDGLVDGFSPADNAGEDRNLNGVRDQNETNPLDPDSNRNGVPDGQEVRANGGVNPDYNAALRSSDCSLIPGTASAGGLGGIGYILGLLPLLGLTRKKFKLEEKE
ncbi:MAG: hypothetical protein COV43_05880 [Deltaproteobacteria bacterium CG11_big_fil_rev_8_21_14_0_20_42_23]|nr:MAG: hypothetical protein COV43_05880 [Deltaproteobacteria bacterium CG11_big_fil_rev_8_21_14_0_20_42_23]PJC64132.1 MAG: hypothetical protein CO021_05815 [Deltaproteobacteria bacterium CG_4_9_14_0_2_um_filter_42_21]